MIHKSDHVIDLCGEPVTGGTGLQNLRVCIQWAEQKFNFEPRLKKVRGIKKCFPQSYRNFLRFVISGILGPENVLCKATRFNTSSSASK
jgi:hypothetical protein